MEWTTKTASAKNAGEELTMKQAEAKLTRKAKKPEAQEGSQGEGET